MAQTIPIIERRRIEAELLKEVYETLDGALRQGGGKARNRGIRPPLFDRASRRSSQNRPTAARASKSFIRIQSNWTAENALEIEPIASAMRPISSSTSPAAATPRCTRPWVSARSAVFCPATATARSAKGTIRN